MQKWTTATAEDEWQRQKTRKKTAMTNQPFSLSLSLDWKDTQTLSYSICLSWCDSKQKLILWSRKSINLDSLRAIVWVWLPNRCVCVYRIWLKNRLKRSNFYGRCTWICLRKFAFVCWLCWRCEKNKLRSFALKQQQQQWQRQQRQPQQFKRRSFQINNIKLFIAHSFASRH